MVARIIKQHDARRIKELQSPLTWLGLFFSTLASLLLVAAVFVGVLGYLSVTKDLPSIYILPTLLEPPNGTFLKPTRFFDQSHQQVILTLENPAAEGRQYLYIGEAGKQVAQSLVDATVQTNDPGFWKESGYSLKGISDGSHPTLAQQLVSNLLLDDLPPSFLRNIQERLLAEEVTAQYGREKVLEWYLNSARYGEFVYGADAASRVYFGKSAEKLSIAEAAMMAALAASPHINPWSASQLLRDSEASIIQSMLRAGMINPDQAQEALMENVHFQPPQIIHSLAPALTNLALLQISAQFPLERLYRGGYEVTTTLDTDLQAQTACTVRGLIDDLQGNQSQAPAKPAQCEMLSLLPFLEPGNETASQGLSVEVIILDPQSGEILAWVGGEDADPAPGLPTVHPVGTILSPFLYLTAFSRGMSPATMLWDLPVSSDKAVSTEVLASYHGPVSTRAAMVNDFSGASAQLVEQVGLENVWQTEKSFGIIPEQVLSSTAPGIDVLNSQHISLLAGVQAYGVLANHGVMVGQLSNKASGGNNLNSLRPISALQVVRVDGQVMLDWTNTNALPVVSEQLAYLTTNVLSDGMIRQNNQGSKDFLDINRPAGAKSTVTTDGLNAWTIGYTPQRVVGTWLGKTPGSLGDLNTAVGSGLWHAVMQFATKYMPIQDFTIPDGIRQVEVCVPSGMLVTPLCPSSKEEVFIQGSEPAEKDNLYQEFFIDRQTDLLATIFTPIELVEKRVYLVLPSAQLVWAEASGLPAPPDGYDTIMNPTPASDQVRITFPSMSGYISGKVDITGSAMGDNFSYYRLQVGKGMNPQQWTQIGEDVHQPVNDGFLGSWDTTGLDGPYVLELQVTHGVQPIERTLILVNIDNNAPQVQVIAPQADQQFTAQSGGAIILQVKVSDDQLLERVEFRIDDELVSTLYQPPYIVLWPASAGLHQLRAVAFDSAGNQSEASISFSVSK